MDLYGGNFSKVFKPYMLYGKSMYGFAEKHAYFNSKR